MEPFFVIAACGAIFVFAAWYDQQKHFLYRFDAGRQLKRFNRIDGDRDKFLFLRGVHHFTFEEMILTALKRKGHKITRNKAYTGDGGIDGRVRIKGRDYYIQAKRYSGHISLGHMKEFGVVCGQAGVRGLFVHTGRTGAQTRREAQRLGIQIVSGDKLLGLFRW